MAITIAMDKGNAHPIPVVPEEINILPANSRETYFAIVI